MVTGRRCRHGCRSRARSWCRCPDRPPTAVGSAPTTICGACRRTVSTTPSTVSPVSTSDGTDLLAIAGEAAAVVRRGPSSIVRFDWRTGEILDGRAGGRCRRTPRCRSPPPSTSCGSTTSPATSSGASIRGASRRSRRTRRASSCSATTAMSSTPASPARATAGADDGAAREPEVREPDDNGIDDPPVARRRSGHGPFRGVGSGPGDGQRLRPRRRGDRRVERSVSRAMARSTSARRRRSSTHRSRATSASTTFDYTIVDGNGTTASAIGHHRTARRRDRRTSPPSASRDAGRDRPRRPP